MKCLDCDKEASVQVYYGDGLRYYLCKEHFLLRRKNKHYSFWEDERKVK